MVLWSWKANSNRGCYSDTRVLCEPWVRTILLSGGSRVRIASNVRVFMDGYCRPLISVCPRFSGPRIGDPVTRIRRGCKPSASRLRRACSVYARLKSAVWSTSRRLVSFWTFASKHRLAASMWLDRDPPA